MERVEGAIGDGECHLPESLFAVSGEFCVGRCGQRAHLRRTLWSSFDVAIRLREVEGGFAGTAEYDGSLFDPSTMARMVDHFGHLLAELLACPKASVFAVPILTESERQQVLYEWNDTHAVYPAHKCIHELFIEQAEEDPGAIAVIGPQGDELSYGELHRRSNQLAHYLIERRVGPESRVSILMERSLEMMVGLMGILKAGAAYVPLDPNYPVERVRFVLEDAQSGHLLAEQHLMDKVGEPPDGCEILFVDSDSWQEMPSDTPDTRVRSDSLAYIIYTSGSTGSPKGAMVEHGSVVNTLCWGRQTLSREAMGGLFAGFSICFDPSVFVLFAPLVHGGCVILGESLLQLESHPRRDKVRQVIGVPSVIQRMLMEGTRFPPSLHSIAVGGEALPEGLVHSAFEQTSIERFSNVYGITECAIISTAVHVARGSTGKNTIGRPISNTQIYILDEAKQLVPIGGHGGNLHRGSRSCSGLSKSSGVDGPNICTEPVFVRSQSQDVPDRGFGSVYGGWSHRVLGSS